LDLDREVIAAGAPGAAEFPVFVPPPYLARMRPGDPDDPLLRQVLPVGAEGVPAPAGYGDDPVGEAGFRRGPGVLTKYAGRALLVTTGVCAVHCRYCFRRHYPYQEAVLEEAVEAVRADESLEEVLLSGGDPLTLAPARLRWLVEALDGIDHVRRLRIHTRLPIVLPSRVDDSLVELLSARRVPVVVVVHANHARELGGDVDVALVRLRRTGAVLLNQAVLLRGVNDSEGAQVALHRALADAGVAAYYLHLLDPVRGAHHFEVPEEEGRRLVEAMRAVLPGWAVPRLVREVPGASGKVPV
jgi:EF-P beta-lysylation protein EpmB